MYGSLHFLSDGLLWRTAFLQMARCSVHTHVCQVCVPCEKWPSHSFHLFKLKSLLFRLKPWHTDLLHTTSGPGSFQSAAHFSAHFLYIIHAIKHIKFNTCHCAAPCSNDTAIWVHLHSSASRRVRTGWKERHDARKCLTWNAISETEFTTWL